MQDTRFGLQGNDVLDNVAYGRAYNPDNRLNLLTQVLPQPAASSPRP